MTDLVNGIDVSAHNGAFSTAGQDFVFIRACYGVLKDSKFDEHFAHAQKAGVVTGAYCFGRNQDGALQADRLLQIAPDAEFLILDREADAGHPTMTVAQARAFVDRLHAKGRKVVLYASESGYPKDAFGSDLRWVANYSRRPRIAFQWWQYQGSPLDRNLFNGTLDELHVLAGRAEPTPGPVPPTGDKVKFIQLSAADADALPSISVPAGTPIETYDGERWTEIGPTNVRVLPGLVDAHSNRRAVVISTGRFYADGKQRPTAQIAVLEA